MSLGSAEAYSWWSSRSLIGAQAYLRENLLLRHANSTVVVNFWGS
jgi:hypothetical protein